MSSLAGEVPIERYPLVCPKAMPFSTNGTIISSESFKRLGEVTKPIEANEPDPLKERMEKLKSQSQMLQMGWSDNKKDLMKRLTEHFLNNTQKDQDLQEIELRKKMAESRPKKRQGLPKSLTGNSERIIEIQKGLLFSEVLAQRKEHEEIAKNYKLMCQEREERELLKRLEHQETIERGFQHRENQRKAFYKSVENFQKNQAEAKAQEEKEAKLNFDTRRSKFVQGVAEDAMAKAFVDLTAEKNKLQSWNEYYKKSMDERAKHRSYMADLEHGLLTISNNQTSVRHHRDDMEKERQLKKVLNNATKQKRAGTWLKENVFDQVVDNEDENIEKDKLKEEIRFLREEEQVKEKKTKMVKGLLKFHEDDQRVKQQRLKQTQLEKEQERDKLERNFHDYINRIGLKIAEHQTQNELYTNFWKKQIDELGESRRTKLQADKDFQRAVKLGEAVDEDEVERYTEQVLSAQQSRGRETYPVRKSRAGLSLGYGAPLVASDNFDNKIFCKTKDIFYRVEDSRNRMSINWDPR